MNPPESSREALVVLDEGRSQHFQSQRQMQMQEEEVDVQGLLERERAIRQLEVCSVLQDKSLTLKVIHLILYISV